MQVSLKCQRTVLGDTYVCVYLLFLTKSNWLFCKPLKGFWIHLVKTLWNSDWPLLQAKLWNWLQYISLRKTSALLSRTQIMTESRQKTWRPSRSGEGVKPRSLIDLFWLVFTTANIAVVQIDSRKTKVNAEIKDSFVSLCSFFTIEMCLLIAVEVRVRRTEGSSRACSCSDVPWCATTVSTVTGE